jgi:hypothetical protein
VRSGLRPVGQSLGHQILPGRGLFAPGGRRHGPRRCPRSPALEGRGRGRRIPARQSR